jgi:hypothetical protein
VTPSPKDRPFDLFDELRIGLERPLQSSEQPNDGAIIHFYIVTGHSWSGVKTPERAIRKFGVMEDDQIWWRGFAA